MLSVVMTFLGIIAFFAAMGLIVRVPIIKIGSYIIALLELMMLVGAVYLTQAGDDITGLMRLNLWIIMTMVLATMLLWGIAMILRWVDMTKNNQDPDSKWVK